jgi:hypothetical protein
MLLWMRCCSEQQEPQYSGACFPRGMDFGGVRRQILFSTTKLINQASNMELRHRQWVTTRVLPNEVGLVDVAQGTCTWRPTQTNHQSTICQKPKKYYSSIRRFDSHLCAAGLIHHQGRGKTSAQAPSPSRMPMAVCRSYTNVEQCDPRMLP